MPCENCLKEPAGQIRTDFEVEGSALEVGGWPRFFLVLVEIASRFVGGIFLFAA